MPSTFDISLLADEIPTPWGPIGYVTYKRTYARALDPENPDAGTEEWPQTVQRVVRACEDQLHCGFTSFEESEVAQMLLGLRGSVAGRFLWQLGTKTVDRYGMLSLQNCAGVSITDPIRNYQWIFDCLMLGVGVGYNIESRFIGQIGLVYHAEVRHEETKDADFIVPDSREGWIGILGRLLKSHFVPSGDLHRARDFTYSTICVRRAGQPIRSFGGVASGPDMLIWGIGEINRILNANAGSPPTSTTLLDVANVIGRVVVSGNVRRSAQLAIGSPDDIEYLHAKRWDLDENYPYYRSSSNNSVNVTRIEALDEAFWEGYKGNGECYGLINMSLAAAVGRTGDTAHPDPNVVVFNPCVTGDTIVLTSQGPMRIDALAEIPANLAQKLRVIVNGRPWRILYAKRTMDEAKVVTVRLRNGFEVRCTPDHQILTLDRGWVAAEDLVLDEDRVIMSQQNTEPTWESTSVPDYGFDEGYALGHLIGDGSVDVKSKTVQWSVYRDPARDGDFYPQESQDIIQRFVVTAGLSASDTWVEQAREKRVSLRSSSAYARWANLFDVRATDSKHLNERMILGTSSDFQRGLVAGLFDTDGSVTDTDTRRSFVHFRQANKQTIDTMRMILAHLGIMTYVSFMDPKSEEEQIASYKPRASADVRTEYIIRRKRIYTLSIATNHIPRFGKRITLRHERKRATLQAKMDELQARKDVSVESVRDPCRVALFTSRVESVSIEKKREPVYDLGVDTVQAFSANGIYVHNCSEQSLENYETCCLAEIFLPNNKTKDELWTTIQYLYRICKHSLNLPCHWRETERIVHKNQRMGLGITGYLQATEEQRQWLPGMYKRVRAYDQTYSAQHGFAESIKLTTVKPSGTLSALAGTTSGCHAAFSEYYLKRMFMPSKHVLVAECRKRGYHVEPLYYRGEDGRRQYDHATSVVDFPITHGPETPTSDKRTAVEQLDVVRRLQREWSDNAVSVTVTYRDEELPAIKEYLAKYWREEMKTVSFMRYEEAGFGMQMPWTAITKDEYDERLARITDPIGSGALAAKAHGEEKDIDMSLECSGGVCPVR